MLVEKDLYKQVENITGIDYEGIQSPNDENKMLVSTDMLLGMIEDLVVNYHREVELKEDYEQYVEDNYKRIPIGKQVL